MFFEWSSVIMVLKYFVSRSLCREDVDYVSDLKEEFGITPKRVQRTKAVDCDCARFDCDGTFGTSGSSSDS